MAALEALPGFLRPDGPRVVVDRTFATVAGGPQDRAAEWCEVAAEELAAAGDPVGAVDLDMAVGAVDR